MRTQAGSTTRSPAARVTRSVRSEKLPRVVRRTLTKVSVPRRGAAPAAKYSAADLARRTIERRAIEAMSWGMPAVNFDLMFPAMVRDAKAGQGSNKVVYWSRPFIWKNQTLTPNPYTIYFMPFFDTKGVGPLSPEEGNSGREMEVSRAGTGTVIPRALS